jgi:hypothetical protein
MSKTKTSKALTALALTGVTLTTTVATSANAFAAEAPAAATSATTTLNGNLAGASLKVTGGEGTIQTLTNGRDGVTRQVTLTIPNLDGALKAGQTTQIELVPTLSTGSQGKQNNTNLTFTTNVTQVTNADGKVIGTISPVAGNSRAINITWTEEITKSPRDINANFTALITGLNDEKVMKTYDLKYKANGIGEIDGGKINLNPAPTPPGYFPVGGVWYGGVGNEVCGVNDAFLKGQTAPHGVVTGGKYEIELSVNKADQLFRIGQDGADNWLKENPNFVVNHTVPTKIEDNFYYPLKGEELIAWAKAHPKDYKLFVLKGARSAADHKAWADGNFDAINPEGLEVRAATGSYTGYILNGKKYNATPTGELAKAGITDTLVYINFDKSTSDKLVLEYDARYDGEAFWFTTASADKNNPSSWGAAADAKNHRCGDVQLTAEAVRAKKTIFTFDMNTYRTDVDGRPRTGGSSAYGTYNYANSSASAVALPKDGNEQKSGPYGVPLVADLMENSSTVHPYTIDKSKTVFTTTEGATISEGGKKIVVPGKATITINANGVATAVPEKGFSGTVVVNYNVFDTGNATTQVPSTATFTWAKQSSLNVAPAEKTVLVNGEKSQTLDPLATAKVEGSTVDASTLKLGDGKGSTSYSFGDSGVTAKVVNGKVVFDHPQNIVGDFTVRYVVSTADGKEAESTVTLHIQPVNTAIGIVTKINGDDANVEPVKLKLGDNGAATGKVTVEVTNTSNSAVTLNESNLTVASANGKKIALPAGFTLAPGETKTLTVDDISVKSGETGKVEYSATQTANIFKRWDGAKVSGTAGSAQTVSDPAKATAEVVSEIPGNPPTVADNPEAVVTAPKAADDTYKIDSDNETILPDIIQNDAGANINGADDPLDVKTLRFLDKDGRQVTEIAFPEGVYKVSAEGVVTFTRTAGYKGGLPSVDYVVSTVSGLTAQAKIHLVNDFKEQPVEPTPDAPKPSEPVVEKPSEPGKKVEAKTGHESTSANPAALAGLFAVVAAGTAATITARRRSES